VYSDVWSPGLRQGDVVGPVFFPSLGTQFSALTTHRSLVVSGQAPVEQVVVPGDRRLVVVVSHDCEFNTGKRNKLLVARTEDIPGNLTPDELEALRESNDIEKRTAEGKTIAGLNSFVFAPLPSVFETERIAVFTTITPLPMKMHDDLVKAKCAELSHEHRVLLRTKLAWFFGRDAEDIDEADKTEPPSQAEPAADPSSAS
jgi:hypothetical protein